MNKVLLASRELENGDFICSEGFGNKSKKMRDGKRWREVERSSLHLPTSGLSRNVRSFKIKSTEGKVSD